MSLMTHLGLTAGMPKCDIIGLSNVQLVAHVAARCTDHMHATELILAANENGTSTN